VSRILEAFFCERIEQISKFVLQDFFCEIFGFGGFWRERERERESFVLKSFDVCYITLMTLFRGLLDKKVCWSCPEEICGRKQVGSQLSEEILELILGL